MLMKRLLGRLIVAGLLAGCASTPPSTFYVLTAIPEAAGSGGDLVGGGVAVGIGPVVFPQFLDRPQLVRRNGSNRLVVDEFNRWGGSVQDDFLRVWGDNLAYLLESSRILIFPSESRMPVDFRITAEVVSFGGTPDGQAVLRVRWAVMDRYLEQALAVREDVYRCPIQVRTERPAGAIGARAERALDAARSEAMVAAMSRCLGDFSRDVASVVGSLPKPAPPAASVTPL
jgi:uncharacterized lipoprotein YmbA